ncbi:MAG: hypothetical protein ABIK97_04065 [candidate division WOR-3 bacterium]
MRGKIGEKGEGMGKELGERWMKRISGGIRGKLSISTPKEAVGGTDPIFFVRMASSL